MQYGENVIKFFYIFECLFTLFTYSLYGWYSLATPVGEGLGRIRVGHSCGVKGRQMPGALGQSSTQHTGHF